MKLNRRTFLWQAGALAASGLILPACSNDSRNNTKEIADKTESKSRINAQSGKPVSSAAIGLQLYTIRESLIANMHRTLDKVAAIGYKEIESAMGIKGHYYGMKPKEFSGLLKDKGLHLRSSHVFLGMELPEEMRMAPHPLTLINNTQQLVDLAAESGQEYLTCAYLFPSERVSMDQYKRWIDIFNKAGEACKKAGLQFTYHNHDFEFKAINGVVPYDLLLAETDNELVKMELDMYWVTKAGIDPLELFKKHPNRFPLWHIKDMAKTQDKNFVEVGTGIIDFKRLFPAADAAGMKYFFVEQDLADEPMESIATSYRNLKQLLS